MSSTENQETSSTFSSGKKVFGKKSFAKKPIAAVVVEEETSVKNNDTAAASPPPPPPAETTTTPPPPASNETEEVTEVKSTKKVFGKKSSSSSVASTPTEPEPTKPPTTTTETTSPSLTNNNNDTSAAATGDGGGEQVQEFKATKKFFGKKSSKTPPPSDRGSNLETASHASTANLMTSPTSNTETNKNNDTTTTADTNPPTPTTATEGEEVTEVKSTKKVFGKKATAKPSPAAAPASSSTTAAATENEPHSNSNPLSPTVNDNNKNTVSEQQPKQQGETEENSQDEALQAPTKKVFTKKSFAQRRQEREQQQDQGENNNNEVPSSSTSVSSSQMAKQPSQQSLASVATSLNNNKKPPGLVFTSSSSATWDDWYDEVCRYFDIKPPSMMPPPAPQSASSSSTTSLTTKDDQNQQQHPTKEQIQTDDWHLMLPSGRTLSWLLIERRYSGEQRVPLLWRASAAGWRGVVDALLEGAAKEDDAEGTLTQRVLTDSGAEDGTSSLYVAAQNGHADICDKILAAARAAPSGSLYQQVLNQRRRTGATSLFIAVQARHLEVVRTLLKAGADLEIANVQKATPLVLACSMDSEDIVDLLLRKGANWRDRQTKKPPLAWAGPKAKEVLELFILRRMWFFRWINRIQMIKERRESQMLSKTPPSELSNNNVVDGVSPIIASSPNEQEEVPPQPQDEKSAADARVSAILDAMLLSMHRKQMKEFLISINEERGIVLEMERNERRDLSYLFAMREPANVSNNTTSNHNKNDLLTSSSSTNDFARSRTSSMIASHRQKSSGLFSPELQPTPEALKSKQLPAWAVMNNASSSSNSFSHEEKDINQTLLSRQNMLYLGDQSQQQHGASSSFCDKNNTTSTTQPFTPSKFQRPSMDSIVQALKKEKEDLAAGRTPKTKHGLPLNQQQPRVVNGGGATTTPFGQNANNSFRSPLASSTAAATTPSASNNFGPVCTTPEAAKYASNLDFSRRREFEWDARLHRISKLDFSPNPKLYEYDGEETTKKDYKSERKPLNPPAKGLRRSDW